VLLYIRSIRGLLGGGIGIIRHLQYTIYLQDGY
jgi:hypothetical protein